MNEHNVQTSTSINSKEITKYQNVPKRICLVGIAAEDQLTYQAAQDFGVPVLMSDTGAEVAEDINCSTVFVLDEFGTVNFEDLLKPPHRILGCIALQQLAEKKKSLPKNCRPWYNLAMQGAVVCFTGFRKKKYLTRLMSLIHFMGGSIRRHMSCKVTHFIANCCSGEKYQYATVFKVPVMCETWVTSCWEQRRDLNLYATADSFIAKHKLKPFYGARVCFVGFSSDETKHMHEVLEANSGQVTQLNDPHCTHVVVNDVTVTVRPQEFQNDLLLKAEWFWSSVQNMACADESNYIFHDYPDCVASLRQRDTHTSDSTSRKRKRMHESIHTRRSSVSDVEVFRETGSFLDCTVSPDKDLLDDIRGEAPGKNLSPRQQVFLELIQTESNYVNLLKTIMTMFKSHLEEMSESEALLNNTELKIIFGNLPPIYETHNSMLEELIWAKAHWTEHTSVGKIILSHSNDWLKAYPPFVNSFETMKEMLIQCDQSKPRFHAFLKVCQTRPECGRQPLQDLLIRPIQRLPSISLLLNDILKHTNKNSADYSSLQDALSAIKEVIAFINEEKRKTEGQRIMFDIFNNIDGCPPGIVSSHRSFISKCTVIELSDELSGRGNQLVLFLFTDQLEVCKKRSKGLVLKHPNSPYGKVAAKPYKHVSMMALNTIKNVIDIRETDYPRVFALVTRAEQELEDKVYSFTITEDIEKSTYLKTLCRHIANTACSTDAEKILVHFEPQQLDIETSDVIVTSLSKAFKYAMSTRIKVGRTFSLNKSSSKSKGTVPASKSAYNISELGNASDSLDETPSNAVQTAKRLKCSSLDVTAFQRF